MDAEVTIIGAGVVGLAVGERLSMEFDDVYIIEKHLVFGQETSSRNSEVIHAGLYYPEGTLKSSLCISGKMLLYDYCRKYEIPFKNCGKLIVATTNDEIPALETINANALLNGVYDLKFLEMDEIKELESSVFAVKALLSPTTGIVDTHSLMKRYETNFLNNNGHIVYGSEVTGIRKIDNGYLITVLEAGNSVFTFSTRRLINCAGLTSDIISQMAGISDDSLRIQFCKGEYFRLKPPKNKLINRLVYPVPHHNLEGIGIHVTIDINGGVKLGPDVTYLSSGDYDYKVTPEKQEAFYVSAKRFLPFLEFDDLAPEMAGIRAKIQKQGEPIKDFYIKEESNRGLTGFVNLIGIESPGLTASLSIANYVRGLIR